MIECGGLDRRQAVRHWVLVPAFAGSNPAGPAIENIRAFARVFSIVRVAGYEPKVRTERSEAVILPAHPRLNTIKAL